MVNDLITDSNSGIGITFSDKPNQGTWIRSGIVNVRCPFLLDASMHGPPISRTVVQQPKQLLFGVAPSSLIGDLPAANGDVGFIYEVTLTEKNVLRCPLTSFLFLLIH